MRLLQSDIGPLRSHSSFGRLGYICSSLLWEILEDRVDSADVHGDATTRGKLLILRYDCWYNIILYIHYAFLSCLASKN